MKKVLMLFLVLSTIFLFTGCDNMFKLEGTNAKNYKILSTKKIEEQGIDAVELVHNKTKAKIILFMCEDENRTFNIAFRTPVNNSKGMPHILEHSVLCGSRKYDVKDPFMQLAKGSLNTFLNAFTFPDKTCYPVASANLKDFHNLVDVYLDAVFYPNVIKDERFFKQEGWHYEIEDKNADLKVNGIVYNEMKGVYSDPDSLLETSVLNTIFDGSTYQYESGGDPEEIINLSYEEFADFHHKYYSASNAIIYYYGKLDYNEELSYLDREYLSTMDFVDCDSEIRLKDNYDRDVEKITYYNADSTDYKNKSYMSRAFALDFEKESIKNIALRVLNYVLFNAEGAILKDKLLNAGLGETISSSYDTSVKNSVYYIVARNIDESKKDLFIKTIDETIKDLIDNGIDKEKLKAALNILYFNYAEGEFGSEPKGLSMTLASLETALYGGSYDTLLKYEEAFEFLNKVNLDDKDNYFTKLLKEVFIDNDHKCTCILNPKYGYLAEKDKKLKSILANRKNAMNDTEIQDIIADVKALKEFQNKEDPKEKLATIPKIELSDIDRDKTLVEYNVKNIDGIEVLSSTDNDRDIVYANLSFDITDFSDRELELAAAMTYLISRIDLLDMSYQEFNNYVDLNTGGFSVSLDGYNNKTFMTYKIKVTKENIDYIFDIFEKLISQIIFKDKERIEILLNEYKSSSYVSMLSNGHVAANTRALSDYIRLARISDLVDSTGIGFNLFIDKFAKNYKSNSELINDTFAHMYNKIISSKMAFQYCANEKYEKEVLKKLGDFIDKQNQKDKNNVSINNELTIMIDKIDEFIGFDDFTKKARKEAIVTSNDVNFCAVANVFDKNKYNGRLNLLRVIFNYEYLWTNLRVLGGAYGCMFRNGREGYYSFMSYRDPNLSNTNKVYIGVADFLKNFDKTDEELETYIIGTMGSYDNPIGVSNRFVRNVAAHYNGVTNDDFNNERHDILDAKVSDIKDLATIFENMEDASFCALISEKSEAEAKNEYDVVWKISR